MMKFIALQCDDSNMGSKRDYKDMKYIVIHFTGNAKDKAVNNCKYFKAFGLKASAHYFVDDGEIIYKSAPLNRIAYSVGGKKYANTKGGKMYGKITNKNSINIEMCSSSEVNIEVEKNTLWLIRFLIKKYNIPKERVFRHYDVTGKLCPVTLLKDEKWGEFLNRI